MAEDPAAAERIVRELARAVRERGGRAWLVGGCVRDVLLGGVRKDFDVEVFGLPATELEALLEREHVVIYVGRMFGVLKVKGQPIDVSLPRRETKIAPGHK